ncbi:MAG TPA: hypothetical protein VE981_10015 [Planctomycetota bacterium]|nr:hypothetical protein [Planctomycetota bacterium]
MSSKLRVLLALAVAAVLPACGNINDGHPAVPFTFRASVSTTGAQANQASSEVCVSGNGQFVVFTSMATTLAQAGPANVSQVFRRNLQSGVTEMVSVDPVQLPGDDSSSHAAISYDGRFVAFESFATNLLSAPQFVPHVYLRDMNAVPATATTLVSQDSLGNPGDDVSFAASISMDGRYVAFASLATNFGDTHTSGVPKIYRRDMVLGDVIPISVTAVGGDPTLGATSYGSVNPSISDDGSVIAYVSECADIVAGDTNGKLDVFVATVGGGGAITTVLASAAVGGGPSNGHSGDPQKFLFDSPKISGNGLFVAFTSAATNLVTGDSNTGNFDVFLYSVADGSLQLVDVNTQGVQAEASRDSSNPSISSDGRFVAFQSVASNLVDSDTNATTDIFLRDILLGITIRVSVDTAGNQAGIGQPSVVPSLSAQATAVAFATDANFEKSDSNGLRDVYVRSPLH